jgi:hypothetical protein
MTKTSTAETPATSKASLQTIEAVRAWTTDTLSHLGISRTRYDVGFHSSFEGFATRFISRDTIICARGRK